MCAKPNIKKNKESQRPALSRPVVILSLLFLALAIFTAFSSSLQNQFTNWDDDMYITLNKSIRKLDAQHLQKIFTSIVTKTYCPLSVLSFAVEYHFFGLQPFYYILDNILLHIGVVLLIYLFALQLGLGMAAAFWGALLFGVHPMHVESVAWITERKDVLYAFFYMVAVGSYWRYLETEKKKWFALSFVAGLLSILAKAMAMSLPLILLLCDWYRGRKFTRLVFIEKAAHAFYIIPIMSVTYLQHARVPLTNFMEGAMIWLWSFTFYLKKFFWPYWFCAVYNVPHPANMTNIQLNIAFIIFAVLIYLLVRFRRDRLFVFAVLYFIFSIFFLVRMRQEVHSSTVGDRFMYLPSLGICLWLGNLFAQRLLQYKNTPWKKYLFVAFLVALFGTLSVKTYYQCYHWKDSAAIWDRVLKLSPNSVAFHNRGVLYMEENKYDLALEYFDEALRLVPNHDLVWYDKGLIYQRRKQYDLALKMYDRAIEINPKYYKSYHNRAGVYLALKKYPLALENCRKALSLSPEPAIYSVCSQANFHMGRYEEAMQDVKAAQKLGHQFSRSYLRNLEDKLKQKNL